MLKWRNQPGWRWLVKSRPPPAAATPRSQRGAAAAGRRGPRLGAVAWPLWPRLQIGGCEAGARDRAVKGTRMTLQAQSLVGLVAIPLLAWARSPRRAALGP